MARPTTRQASSAGITEVQIGPWPAGLNNREGNYGYRDIKSTELLKCMNFDIHENGFLENRRGFVQYSADVATSISNVTNTINIRNVLGSVRIDTPYNEGIIQIEDIVTNDIYLKRNAVHTGEVNDLRYGYWVKKAVSAGSKFWLTSVVRYDKNIYFTTNNAYLNEDTDFTGGFYYGAPEPFDSSVIVNNLADIAADMCADSAGNMYLLIPNEAGTCKIVKITQAGAVSDFVTNLSIRGQHLAIDPSDNLYVNGFGANWISAPILKITQASVVSTFVPENFTNTSNFAYTGEDPIVVLNGSLYAVESFVTSANGNSGTSRLVKWDLTTGVKTTLFTGPVGDANIANNTSFTIDPTTLTLWAFKSNGLRSLDNITPGYHQSSFATALAAILTQVKSFQIDADGNYYITDFKSSGSIYKMTAIGAISVLKSNLNMAMSVYDGTNFWVYEQANNRILKLTPLNAPTLISIPGMPFGDKSFIFKDRMFIVDKTMNRIYYSKATDPTLWDTSDDGGSFDVNPGDGQTINDVVIIGDTLYIFKESASWVFTFTNDPGLDGVLKILSADRGAWSATTYNNQIYIVGPQGVQHLLSGFFIDISQQVKGYHPSFSANSVIDTVGNTLLVTLGLAFTPPPVSGGSGGFLQSNAIIGKIIALGNYGSDAQILAMNLLTGAWSTYILTNADSSPIFRSSMPIRSHIFNVGNQCAMFLAEDLGAFVIGAIHPYKTDNNVSLASTTRVFPAYSMLTGYFDFGTPVMWKKLKKLYSEIMFTPPKVLSTIITSSYPMVVSLNFYAPEVAKKFTATIDDETSVKPPLGPDAFPVFQAFFDVAKNEFAGAQRFQVLGVGFDTDVIATTSNLNNQLVVLKNFAGYFSQRSSFGAGENIQA